MELLLWQLTHFSTQLVTTITLVGILIQLVGLALCLWFYFTRKPPKTLSAPYPGVTLVKPCFKAEDNEQENFASHFRQDYPGAIEILFVVSRETDPVVPIVRDYIAKNPKVDA